MSRDMIHGSKWLSARFRHGTGAGSEWIRRARTAGAEAGDATARGEIDALPRPEAQLESLKGIGDFRTMWRYLPRVAAAHIRVPTLIIDQEQEETGGREKSRLAVTNVIPSTTILLSITSFL